MNNKRDLLLSELNKNIEKFEKDSERHKSMYRCYRYWVFGCAALSSILAGGVAKFFPHDTDIINSMIVIISAISGIVTSIEGLRKPQDTWIRERYAYHKLKDLRREVLFETDENEDNIKKIHPYFLKMQTILETAEESWLNSLAGSKPEAKDEQNGHTPEFIKNNDIADSKVNK
ncbi:hypothetical protein DOJK_01696 [Patescibacteria group bacterium]|nr:hypothetical protein DOJK_01696 [Patescibacteria group bacterium]